ncbi:DCP2 [Malassezia furfur]|nr:DCP2 [Malassezia furfur]
MGKAKGGAPAEASAKSVALREELENLSCRFIVNLPANELASIERIGFQVEQAYVVAPHTDIDLPELNLKRFSEEILHVSSLVVPLIRLYMEKGPKSLELAFSQFMQYKTRVPCVLVKGWSKGASWTFPKGKINQDEPERDCALREVREETGVDASHLLPPDSRDYLELTMREQKVRLYIVPGLSEDTPMETQTRREISRIEWFPLSDLPTGKKDKKPRPELGGKFYLITPFVTRLRQWIQANKRTHPHKPPRPQTPQPAQGAVPTKAEGESVSLDALFGAAAPVQRPGLIALPPAAQKQMQASRPQTPSSPQQKRQGKANGRTPGKAQNRSAKPSPQGTPQGTPRLPAQANDSSKLLLNLLQGSQPVPAPQAESEPSREDGSTALRNMLGLKSDAVPSTLQPSGPQSTTSREEHQAQLYSLLGMPHQTPAQPPASPWPAVGVPPSHGPWRQRRRTDGPAQALPSRPRRLRPPRRPRSTGTACSGCWVARGLPRPPRRTPLQASSESPHRARQAPAPFGYPGQAGAHMPPLPQHLPHYPQSMHQMPPHQPPRPPHFGAPAGHPDPWHGAPSRSMPTSPPAAGATPQSHQHALLSTLLSPPASSARPPHITSPHAPPPEAMARSPAPANNSANLLGILNQPRSNSSPSTPGGSAPSAQAQSNPLLATLLGK